jgi:hypothetical protein
LQKFGTRKKKDTNQIESRRGKKKKQKAYFCTRQAMDYIDHVGEREKKKRNQAKENSLEKNKQNTSLCGRSAGEQLKTKKRKTQALMATTYAEQDGAR